MAFAVMFAAVLLASCGESSEPEGEATEPARSVSLENIAYKPSTLEVSVGEEVTWTNNDEDIVHTVTAGEPGTDSVPGVSEGKPAKATGEFESGEMQTGDEFSFTFEETGTFTYFCEIHPSMTAEISVS